MALRFVLSLLLVALCGCPTSVTPVDDDDSSPTDCSDIGAGQNPPEVVLTAPPQSEIFAATDNLSVIGSVRDEGTDPADIALELLDVTDVTPAAIDLDLPEIGSDDSISFVIPGGTFEMGPRVIRLRATDPDGCQGFDDRFFCIDTADCVEN